MGTVTLTSPWVWSAIDYQNAVIRISVDFNTSTSALLDAVVHRDASCVYTQIVIGTGADGTVATSSKTFNVPVGTTTVTAAQLNLAGLHTIQDVWALQITAQ